MKFFILDERHVWFEPALQTAAKRGYEGRRIRRGAETIGQEGVGFIRPHADPIALELNQEDFAHMDRALTMIQDCHQVTCYEDKSLQVERWGRLMPPTWRFVRKQDALDFIAQRKGPKDIVSKADVGASSVNVRILKGYEAQRQHVLKVFDHGIPVNHCSGGAKSVQKGYVLLQEFIPHAVTWRVNVVGRQLAGFMRYCYPDKEVAQTGNTDPILTLTPQVESLFDYARQVFSVIDTRWCAIDVLWDETSEKWKLLETSLAWPWPGVGKQAPFFGTNRHWGEIWDVMFDELEAGVWS